MTLTELYLVKAAIILVFLAVVSGAWAMKDEGLFGMMMGAVGALGCALAGLILLIAAYASIAFILTAGTP